MTPRDVRLTAHTDATGFGGAERVLSTLLAGLSTRFEITVAGVDARVIQELASARMGASAAVLPAVAGKRDAAGIRAHFSTLRRLRSEVLVVNLWHPSSCQYALAAAIWPEG